MKKLVVALAVAVLTLPFAGLIAVPLVLSPAALAACQTSGPLVVTDVPENLTAIRSDGVSVTLGHTQLTRASTIVTVGSGIEGVGRQGVVGKLAVEGPVDLTGLSEVVRGWRGREVSIGEVKRAIELVRGPLSVVRGEFDLVLSSCVLSQLLCGVRDVLGKDHPGWRGLKGAIVRRHLRDVVGLARPGGQGVVVVDVSSTGAIAGLDRAREEEWGDLMRVAVGDGKCFAGLEPGALRGVLREDERVAEVRVSSPWVWHLGWGKAFLCYGMTIVRR